MAAGNEPQLGLVALATAILKDATAVEEYLKERGLPQPSFLPGAPPRLNMEDRGVAEAHERVLNATRELHHLTLGPMQSLTSLVSFEDPFAISVLNKLEIALHVPLDGTATFEHLSEKTGVPLADLRHILRMAMTSYVFTEPTPGSVAHTAASKLLRESAFARNMITFRCDEQFIGSAKAAEALVKYKDEEPQLSGWGFANDATKPLFDELAEKHPERFANFKAGVAIVGATAVPRHMVLQGFDWAGLGPGTRVVDIGGGGGEISVMLAREYPNLSFVVQDYEDDIRKGEKELAEDLKNEGRVTFMPHSFLDPQPIKDADVYFFRSIFQNWPTKYAIRILRNLIPALKKGAKIRIHDPMTPDKGLLSPWQERQKLSMDSRMYVLFKSHHRYADSWSSIFAEADPRFRIISIKPSHIAARAMINIDVAWDE
ncbi:S-adenosyl-L-methionine-dependent methyltransferase [Lepidopterella palustris CBS 459.81]|uniref:S-adenosyl-L-methionine-dependent methyltransferase n=1 Tax=Lepidopterella palustris CBS 459.81 TaxID=1314670 RepID=A0A8E2DWK5_9PEZI|nr:S-adenosyl-L-methionine-dependent methyltransferase [Lepidopterella palustris CBS 459.81]